MTGQIFAILLGAIVLDGVSGDRMAARAAFNANNVRVGDPLTLTVDFRGNAEFRDLHPPALSREVDSSLWKVDDASAKTETGDYGRRLVYRVRPLREGLHRFPSLEFAWEGGMTATKPIPVHVRPGVQAALSGLEESADGLPMPDGIVIAVTSRKLTDDEAFAWRKACSRPTADGFAKFDFSEARLNEAACHVIDGNWAKALKIYARLEWSIGQTPEIERGMVAALARKTNDAAQELPAWRMAFRPVLRHAWKGRLGIVGGTLAALALLFWICGKAIRRLAAVALALVLVHGAAYAQGSPFDEFDRMHQQMMQQFEAMMQMGAGGSGFSSSSFQIGTGGNMKTRMVINGKEVEPPKLVASVMMSTNDVQIGQKFDFILSLEVPKGVNVDNVRSFQPSEMFGMVFQGNGQGMTDGKSGNPSNRVIRAAFPVRYDVPFKGNMTFSVAGQYTIRQRGFMGGFSMPFQIESAPLYVEIKPLPTENQPADFSGAIGTGFKLKQTADRTKVATNDVVRVRCELAYDGYMPPDAVDDVIARLAGRQLIWETYFVADGADTIPAQSLVYYNTSTRQYNTAAGAPIRLTYIAEDETETEAVAVDAAEKGGGRTVVLHFAPSESSPIVEKVMVHDGTAPLRETERKGEWRRLDSGRHSGWAQGVKAQP